MVSIKCPVVKVEVTIEKWKDQRSVQQNRYYWGVVVKIISDDTGNDPETVHEFLKAKFLPARETIIKDEKRILAGCTHDLNKDNFFADYVDPIRAWYAEFGYIPDPNEISV